MKPRPLWLLGALLALGISADAAETPSDKEPFVDEARLAELATNRHSLDPDGLLELALGYDERHQTTLAVEHYRAAASQGVGPAELRLGFLYEIGNGVPQSYVDARVHYQKAISLGVPEANLRLGLLCLEGWGAPADPAKAVAYVKAAADVGYAPAQQVLSDMYFAGIKVRRDLQQALFWAERAATSRDPAAQLRVGEVRRAAVKLPQDLQLAREWFQLSAEQDYTRGMLAMARTFLRPDAEPAEVEIGLRWLDLAAAGGNAGAAFYRAGAYLDPRRRSATPNDEAKARVLLQQAADAGEFGAIEVLELEKAGQPLRRAFAYVMTVPFDDRYVQRMAAQSLPDAQGRIRPQPLKVVRPVYPAALSLAETTGEVMVEFIVDNTGRVREPRAVNSTHPGFAGVAAASLAGWRFLPGQVDGRPVNTRMRVLVYFRQTDVQTAGSVPRSATEPSAENH